MSVKGQAQRKLQQDYEAQSKPGAHSIITVSVSSVTPEDDNPYLKEVMVYEIDGGNEWLCTAWLDTGCMQNLIGEPLARQAVALKLTTIQRGNFEPIQGIAKGTAVPVLGKIRLRFFIDEVPYKATFLVVPGDERYDMFLGGKFLEKSGLLQAKTKPNQTLAGHL